MPELVTLPNLAALLVGFLLDQDEVQDILDGDNVYTELPKDKPEYMVRVTQFNDLPQSNAVLHLVASSFTVECFGGAKVTTEQLARVCYAALHGRLPGSYDGYVVTGCNVGGLRDQPDPELITDKGRVRPRWLFTATVYGHPVASGS